MEAGGGALREGGSGEEVVSELVDDELVVGEVFVDGVDDPVAVAPGVGAGAVLFRSRRCRRSVRIEPVAAPSLAEMGRGEEGVDEFFVGCGAGFSAKASATRGSGEPDEIEVEVADEGSGFGLGAGLDAGGFEALEDEGVDGAIPPAGGGFGYFGAGYGVKGPVVGLDGGPPPLPFRQLGAGLDPSLDSGEFFRGEGVALGGMASFRGARRRPGRGGSLRRGRPL